MVIHIVICGHWNVGSAWVRGQISLCFFKRWGSVLGSVCVRNR